MCYRHISSSINIIIIVIMVIKETIKHPVEDGAPKNCARERENGPTFALDFGSNQPPPRHTGGGHDKASF